MNRISKHQLFSLMFIFEIGSTTLFALGIEAKQDAWIVILVAMLIGLVFAWIYTELQSDFPEKNFIEIIISVLGKWLGIPLSLLYAVYWLWPAARNLREFGELISLTLLPTTPLTIILLTFVLSSLYVLMLGIEVLGRTAETTIPLVTFFLALIFFMILITGDVEISNLKPIMAEGIGPILKNAYPNVALFPFGEIFIFSMYWCYVDKKNAIRKAVVRAIIFSGLIISFTLAVYVTTLGVEYSSISTIPFVVAVKLIDIGEFVSNLDSLGIILIFLGGFYKMSLFLNGVTLVIATVFKIKDHKKLLPIVGVLLLIVAIAFEPSYTYHRWMTPFDTNTFYITFLHIIPTLIFLIHRLKINR